MGSGSGLFNNSGTSNTFIGLNSGYGNYSGSNNVALGANSYYSCVNGSQNVLIGDGAGYHLTGSGNVCIGYQAGYGYDANGSNKLYIANSATPTPLIYGDFSTNQLVINGSLGVGVTLANNPNGYKFAVNGKIGAKEVQIENTSTTWPDYVFKNDFKLRSLADVESFIKANGHLPEIPSEKQVKQEGIKVGEMNAKLLQKIEELTLYLIEANKRIDDLSKEVKELQSKK